MSQLIVCRTRDGIVLGVDAKAMEVDAQGRVIHLTVERLFPLGPRGAVAAGGHPEGVETARALSRFVAEEKLEDMEDIYSAALSFLSSCSKESKGTTCQEDPAYPIHDVHFILAGISKEDRQSPYRIYLVGGKRERPQRDGEEIRRAYTVPRRVAFEYRLNMMAQRGASTEEVLREVRSAMEALTWYKEEVGPPYRFAVITKDAGYRDVSSS